MLIHFHEELAFGIQHPHLDQKIGTMLYNYTRRGHILSAHTIFNTNAAVKKSFHQKLLQPETQISIYNRSTSTPSQTQNTTFVHNNR